MKKWNRRQLLGGLLAGLWGGTFAQAKGLPKEDIGNQLPQPPAGWSSPRCEPLSFRCTVVYDSAEYPQRFSRIQGRITTVVYDCRSTNTQGHQAPPTGPEEVA
jgi:hypothetical protein